MLHDGPNQDKPLIGLGVLRRSPLNVERALDSNSGYVGTNTCSTRLVMRSCPLVSCTVSTQLVVLADLTDAQYVPLFNLRVRLDYTL